MPGTKVESDAMTSANRPFGDFQEKLEYVYCRLPFLSRETQPSQVLERAQEPLGWAFHPSS